MIVNNTILLPNLEPVQPYKRPKPDPEIIYPKNNNFDIALITLVAIVVCVASWATFC